MKKERLVQPLKPARIRRPLDKPEKERGERLSKTLPEGDKTPPADRGACEKEASVQGSE